MLMLFVCFPVLGYNELPVSLQQFGGMGVPGSTWHAQKFLMTNLQYRIYAWMKLY